MQDMKSKILGIFWDEFVLRNVPPSDAHVGTFGGLGYEEKHWRRRRIPETHGWLVERNAQKRRRLIPLGYRILNELRALPQILAGLGDDRAYLDAFHLDLEGTLTKDARSDLAEILPLVFKGAGKCLAITVADARRNLILEEWPEYLERGRGLFGRDADSIYESILQAQREVPVNPNLPAHFKGCDPENAAKREYGLLIEIADLLRSQRIFWQPIQMKRFVYISTYAGSKWRMRTFFFRFYQIHSGRPAKAFARRWAASPFYYGNNGQIQEIAFNRTSKTNEKGGHMPNKAGAPVVPNLATLVSCASEPIQREYELLCKQAAKLDSLKIATRALQDAGLLEIPAPESEPASVQRTARPALRSGQKKMQWDDLSPEEQIMFQIEAAELRAQTNGDWKPTWRGFILKKFGYESKGLRYSLRAAYSQTRGKLREKLRSRIAEVFGDKAGPLIERLDTIPV